MQRYQLIENPNERMSDPTKFHLCTDIPFLSAPRASTTVCDFDSSVLLNIKSPNSKVSKFFERKLF